MRFTVFEFKRATGNTVREVYDNGQFFFELDNDKIELYKIGEESRWERNLYLGHTMEEVLAAGRDILGEELTKNGDPSYDEVKTAMPEITEKAFCFLASPASWAGVTVDRNGLIYPQQSGRDNDPAPFFIPSKIDSLASIEPIQMLVAKKYPILISIHTNGNDTLEFLYFVEPGDTDRDPIVWIREKRYNVANPESFTLKYRAASILSDGSDDDVSSAIIADGVFLEALCDTIIYWSTFIKQGMQLELPAEQLASVGEGAMAYAALTFTADQPHYGHKYYGKEVHDNFPPNYIWTIEAACITGRTEWARRIFSHLLKYGLSDEGRICYRQGKSLISGSSATEYGMLLWISARYKNILMPNGVAEKYKNRLAGMGNIILAHCVECPEFKGKTLVKMCAEADNNVRINVYLNNNLWAIRGLRALADILGKEKETGEKYLNTANILEQNIGELIEEYAECSTPYGDVVPFRFGYPTIPYTLSNCEEFSVKVDECERERYFVNKPGRRDFDVTEQEITENTYANYRYYPEILSAMLLPENYAEGISNMRDTLGGNILGMTRFRSWIDNWPVLNYARFLIESDKIEKYLLLLYAHTAHHGHPDLMCYYEQIKVWGEVSAPDCVPSLLTTPTMLAWMFAYERVKDGKLILLSALPKEWYDKPFSVKKVGCSRCEMDIENDGSCISITFTKPTDDEVELVWRSKSIIGEKHVVHGKEFIKEIHGNVLILKKGLCAVKISVM